MPMSREKLIYRYFCVVFSQFARATFDEPDVDSCLNVLQAIPPAGTVGITKENILQKEC